jgi:hypothetical protein
MADNLFISNSDTGMANNKLHTIKKNPYAYFFLKLFGLILLVFVIDFSAGKVLRHYYFKQQNGLLYRTTYAIEKTTEDVLIFGSSRANHHYHPEVFEKKLGKSYYNAGRDGHYNFYHYAVLQGVLKRYTPEIVILDFISGELKKDQESYDRLSSLLPYYKSHPEIRPVAELKGPFEKYKLCSSIYPYSSLIFTIAAGNMEFNKDRSGDIKGYVPLTNEWDQPIVTYNNPPEVNLDSVKVKIFESFIKDCIQSKTKLYIVCSPYFHKSEYYDPSVIKANEIAGKYNIDFFDFSRDTVFTNNGGLFSDVDHLNDKGARIFSEKLIDTITATGKSRIK